jgi:predicted RNA binding protein YcfA (HicA-like mRNA interferase family)
MTMSGQLLLKPHEVVAQLEALGFVEVRQRGAHKQFRDADSRETTLPCQEGRSIAPVLLRQITRDVGVIAEELVVPVG